MWTPFPLSHYPPLCFAHLSSLSSFLTVILCCTLPPLSMCSLSPSSLSSALSHLFIMLISPLLCSSRSDIVISLAWPNWLKCYAFFLPKHRFSSGVSGEADLASGWFFWIIYSPITVYMTRRQFAYLAAGKSFFSIFTLKLTLLTDNALTVFFLNSIFSLSDAYFTWLSGWDSQKIPT